MLNAKRLILGSFGLALIIAGVIGGIGAWILNYMDTTGTGPQDIVCLLGIGAIFSLVAGIYFIWRAIQTEVTAANKFSGKLTLITVLIAGAIVVTIIIWLGGGFRPTHQVTVIVTGQGEAVIDIYNPPAYVETEVVTLPWSRTISTKERVGINVHGESGVVDLQCSLDVDGEHVETRRATDNKTEDYVRCSYNP